MPRSKSQELIEKNAKDLDQINAQRRMWLYASSVVVIATVFLIFGWDWLDQFHSKSIWWVTVSVMIVLSVNWWYWTMRVMLRLIQHQRAEFFIIGELIKEIKQIRKEVRHLGNQDIDNPK